MFYVQRFADILATEADDHDIEAELVDLSDCEPEDDLIVTVVSLIKQFLLFDAIRSDFRRLLVAYDTNIFVFICSRVFDSLTSSFV